MSVSDDEKIEVKKYKGIVRLRFCIEQGNACFHYDLFPSEAEELADMLNKEAEKARKK